MTSFDRAMISGYIVTMMVFVVFSVNVFVQVLEHIDAENQASIEVTDTDCYLPCKCRKYYNLGTGQWIECMQVGKK